ncbi:MAG: peptidyl-tRNA hydrolase [Candidatus Angelobacter sp.]|nr:peptidyl-tRNA hydrolase [Candidatus Angelobacter sp.]
MKLIVGLGNPGIEYQFTPHNMGYLAIERIAERCKVQVTNRHCKALTAKAVIENEPVLLAKPETFMNLSGMSVRELWAKYGEANELSVNRDLIVIYDELDFPLGTIKVQERGSSAGHNGMESVIGALGTQEFLRIRMGIGPDHPVSDGARYVLSPWKKKELSVVDEMLDRTADAVEVILKEGVAAAMNKFNRKAESAK